MSLSDYAEAAVLNALLRNVALQVAQPYLSIHTDDPGETGANEVATTRQEVTFNAPSGGSCTNNGVIDFTDQDPAVIKFVGIWDALTTGNFLVAGVLTPETPVKGVFTATNTGDLFTSEAHGLSNDDAVVLYSEGLGVTLPTGVSAGTIYYIISATTNTFQLSTTKGGSAIALTADGNGGFVKADPKTIANAGDTFEIPDAGLTISVY